MGLVKQLSNFIINYLKNTQIGQKRTGMAVLKDWHQQIIQLGFIDKNNCLIDQFQKPNKINLKKHKNKKFNTKSRIMDSSSNNNSNNRN